MRLLPIAVLVLLAPAATAAGRTGWDPGFAATAYHVAASEGDAADAVELRFSAAHPRASLRISASWVRVDGDVILAGSGGAPASGRQRNRALGNGPGGVAAAAVDGPGASDVSGLGDLRLQGRALLTEGRSAGRLLARGGVKLPTADEDEGLGTGKTDLWAGLGWIREGWTTDLEAWAEWVSLGDSPDLELEDGPTAGLALGWSPRRGRIWAGLEGWAESIEGEGSRAVAFLETRWPLTGRVAWSLEAQAGLTDASPDFGFSLGLLF